MIEKTFCHIEGISENMEKILWKNGICNWNYFLENYDNIECLSNKKLEKIREDILVSKENLSCSNIKYFKNKLHVKHHYRLANLGKIAYVDIETTGLSRWIDKITMIGIYDGIEAKSYIYGQDLELAYEKLKEFDIVVTFNGKIFDIPFIQHKCSYKYDLIHLDLRYLLKEFGLFGGLKKIELELGLKRDEEVTSIDGFEAVRLWKKFEKGDIKALKKLIKYNHEDIINLKYLLDWYLTNKKNNLFN